MEECKQRFQPNTSWHVEKLLQSYDFTSLLARFQKEQPNEAKIRLEIVNEYKRFLLLKVMHHDVKAKILSPSPLVDVMWHLHILDSASYSTMCENLPFFVHHNPDGGVDASARQHRYGTTLDMYREKWGAPPTTIWPKTLENQPDSPKPATPTDVQHVVIKESTGKVTRVNIDFDVTVEILKVACEKLNEVPPNLQRLVWKGRQLEDGHTLSDYKMQSGDSVHLILRLRGC